MHAHTFVDLDVVSIRIFQKHDIPIARAMRGVGGFTSFDRHHLGSQCAESAKVTVKATQIARRAYKFLPWKLGPIFHFPVTPEVAWLRIPRAVD